MCADPTLTYSRLCSTTRHWGRLPTAALQKSGSGNLTLWGSNTYTGVTTVCGGTLQLGARGGGGSLSTSSTIIDNATMAFSRSNTVTQGIDFTAAAIAGSGELVQMGPGTLVLGVSNGYSGGTKIAGGIVQVGDDAALGSGSGSLSVSSGTLDVHGNYLNVGSLSGSGAIDNLFGSGSLIAGNGGAATRSRARLATPPANFR